MAEFAGIWFSAPGQTELRTLECHLPGHGEVQVQSLHSLISAGTELLYFRGEVPPLCLSDSSLLGLKNISSYPLSYGYAVVGRVTHVGPQVRGLKRGDLVFCYHPHWALFNIRVDELVVLPVDMDPLDGVFLANMETALTLVLDLAPQVGERIKVFGLGTLGLLSSLVLKSFPLETLSVYDKRPDRLARGQKWDLSRGDSGPWDGVLEVSGNSDAFNQAVEELDFSGRLVLGSWYGTKEQEARMGGSFHQKRIKIVSSQVSSLAPELTGRWDKRRLRTLAVRWLERLRPSLLITHHFTLESASEAYELLARQGPGTGAVVFDYS